MWIRPLHPDNNNNNNNNYYYYYSLWNWSDDASTHFNFTNVGTGRKLLKARSVVNFLQNIPCYKTTYPLELTHYADVEQNEPLICTCINFSLLVILVYAQLLYFFCKQWLYISITATLNIQIFDIRISSWTRYLDSDNWDTTMLYL